MLIYAVAALMDVIIFFITFVVMYRAGVMQYSKTLCMMLGISIAFGYVIGSCISGKIVNRHNSRKILLISTIAGFLFCLPAIFLNFAWLNILSLAVFGFFNGLFFNAFQAFMRGVPISGGNKNKGIFYTVALYNLSWCSGVSFGFLFSGSFYNLGHYVLFFFVLLIHIIIILIIYKSRLPVIKETAVAESNYNNEPLYLWIGWIMVLMITFFQRSIQTFFPVVCARINITPFLAGLPLFLMMFGQAVFSCFLANIPRVFYQKKALLIANTLMLFVFIALWLLPYYLVYIFGFIIFGLYGSFIYFSSVLYANNYYKNRSENVGINELIVGIGGIAGIVITSLWMDAVKSDNSMYLLYFVFLLASTVVVLFMRPHVHARE